MSTKTSMMRISLLVLLACMVTAVSALAGTAVVGSVAGSTNATVGGQSLLPNTTIFSGDSVQVRDGVAVFAVGKNGRVVFGRDTVASFQQDASDVTVLLTQGNVSVFHSGDGAAVRVKAGDVTVAPRAGFKSYGEVAMLNGSVVVSAKEGTLQVDDHGTTKTVAKGQTIVIAPRTAQKQSGGGGWGGGSEALEIAAVAAAGTAAVLAGVALSRADNANTNATNALAASAAATTAANNAATAAAAAATAAAQANTTAQNALLLAECTYDYTLSHSFTSPIVISGTCPGAP